MLLKLESVYNVSGRCVDDLVEQLHFIYTLSVQHYPKLIDDIFTRNNCAVDEIVVNELIDKLSHSNPLRTTFGPDGPFSSKFKRGEYFKENVSIIQPVFFGSRRELQFPILACSSDSAADVE